VPFRIALSFGKNIENDGITAGLGRILRLSINTTRNTNKDTAATKRNINLSVIFIRIRIKNSFST
jgi:hypothetical protein